MKEIIMPFRKPLMALEGFHEDFVNNSHFPATIKDVQTARYVACNEKVASLAGLTPHEYCGKTAYEIQDMLRPGYRAITDKAIEMDRRIITKSSGCVRYKHTWFTSEKYIFIETVTKIPIISQFRKVSAILAYGYDITRHIDLFHLFSLYEAYHLPKEAICYFLKHIQLGHFFTTPLTRRELIVLLVMRESESAKYVARRLNLSPKTIDENKARLRGKLRGITLESLLVKLRAPPSC